MISQTYITSLELVEALEISSQELLEVEQFFDLIPDDEWELHQGKDYRVVNQTTGLREYTLSGAYTIARYLESIKSQGFWAILKEWFTHKQRNLRRSFLKKKILTNCSSLCKSNSQFFISRSDVVAIFGTRSDYLTKMAEHTQRTTYPLIKGQDYENLIDQGELYFSLSGISKLSQAFADCHTKKNRREECQEIGDIIDLQIRDISKQILDRDKRIRTAKDKAKIRDKKTCLVSEKKSDRVNQVQLAAHHLYSQNEYPFLADSESNLITVTCEVHRQFHQDFMGGSVKTCTIDDFMNFVHQYYPENSQVIIWLEQKKLALGNPKPVATCKPHVLYLPASRIA
jgi:hypothetical protein